jgi:hypothetical protein
VGVVSFGPPSVLLPKNRQFSLPIIRTPRFFLLSDLKPRNSSSLEVRSIMFFRPFRLRPQWLLAADATSVTGRVTPVSTNRGTRTLAPRLPFNQGRMVAGRQRTGHQNFLLQPISPTNQWMPRNPHVVGLNGRPFFHNEVLP